MSQTKLSKVTLVLLLMTGIFTGFATISSDQTESVLNTFTVNTSAFSVPNGPLNFTGDSHLTDYGFPGDGSSENPYLFNFENYTFAYSFNSTTVGIHIENITKHVVISNYNLTNTNTSVRGIGINILANNIVIKNTTIKNTVDGIHLGGENLTVIDTVINSLDFGIKAIDCSSLNITNTSTPGVNYGVYFEYCNQTKVNNSRFENDRIGVQLIMCTNFEISDNIFAQNSEKGLLIVEPVIKTGSLNFVVRNKFSQNQVQAMIITSQINTVFYNESAKEGNFWSDWRRWGKYTIQTDVFDLYPMGLDSNGNIEIAKQFPFKFWFWIFAPTIVVLGTAAYFFYWKPVAQPSKQ